MLEVAGFDSRIFDQISVRVTQDQLQARAGGVSFEFKLDDKFGATQIIGHRNGHMNINDSGRESLESHAAPETGGNQFRTPIPAVMVLGFAHKQPARVAVPQWSWPAVRGLESLAAIPRILEQNTQFVATNAKFLRDIHPMRHKKIIRLEGQFFVQPDFGKGVQTVETQVRPTRGFSHFKLEFVHPIGFANPLHVQFIHAEKRIGNQTVRHQIRVRGSGHPSASPAVTCEIHLEGFFWVSSLERPTRMQNRVRLWVVHESSLPVTVYRIWLEMTGFV